MQYNYIIQFTPFFSGSFWHFTHLLCTTMEGERKLKEMVNSKKMSTEYTTYI